MDNEPQQIGEILRQLHIIMPDGSVNHNTQLWFYEVKNENVSLYGN